jgi:hypothetical protein
MWDKMSPRRRLLESLLGACLITPIAFLAFAYSGAATYTAAMSVLVFVLFGLYLYYGKPNSWFR